MIAGQRTKLRVIYPLKGLGGTERVAKLFIEAIETELYEVEVIIIGSFNINLKFNNKVTYRRLSSESRLGILFYLFLHSLRTREIVFVSFFNSYSILLLLIKLMLPFMGVKVILRSNTNLSAFFKRNGKRLEYYLSKILLKKSDMIIAQSNLMASDLNVHFKVSLEKIRIISNPLLEYDDLPAEVSPRFINSKVRYLSVGNLRSVKGYFRLIDAFKLVVKVESSAQLFIVGDGPLKQEIDNYIKFNKLVGNVTLLGSLENITYYYKNSDVFLFASYFEGYPNVLVEATVFKLPIVAYADCIGLEEIVLQGENGFLVYGGVEDFASKVQMARVMNVSELKFEEFKVKHSREQFTAKIKEILTSLN